MSTPDQDSSVQSSTDVAARAAVELELRAKMSVASKQGYTENIERFVRFRDTKADEWIELQVLQARAVNEEFPPTMYTHVDDESLIADACVEAEKNFGGIGVFYIANEIRPQVRLRAPVHQWNRAARGGSTTDENIAARKLFFIDIDPVKPVKGITANDEESAHAIEVAVTCYSQAAIDLGSSDALGFGFSGNGVQVHFALACWPVSEETDVLIKRVLVTAKMLFENDKVQLDTSVGDRKRLCPAFGTMKCKGTNEDPTRPFRQTWFACSDTVHHLTIEEVQKLLAIWMARLTPDQQAAVDKAIGQNSLPPSKSKSKSATPKTQATPVATAAGSKSANGATSKSQKSDVFSEANNVLVTDVASWLGIENNGFPTCTGCGTVGSPQDTSVSFIGNGVKCLHARCAHKGKSGFRTNVDLVVEVKGVTPIAAAQLVLAQFQPNVSLPTSSGQNSTSTPVQLIEGKRGPITSVANVLAVLTRDTRWADVVVYDEFREAVTVRRTPPCRPDDAPQRRTCEEWTEQDSTRTAAWLIEEYGLNVRSALIDEAVTTVAQTHIIHPVREYFRSLVWDGTPRLDKMLPTYFGTEDTTYSRGVGSRWMISAVARVEIPGCQVDCMLVLESPKQGTKKTTAFRKLVPHASLYNDTGLNIGDKDSYQNLRGVFIYGFDELDSIRRSELTKTKNFISQTRDRYRPPYARRARDFERQNVFCGTTNEEQYLTDRTGNRRFWPVRVITQVDDAAIERDRDQLWAEAFARFSKGEKWHVNTPEFRELCEAEQVDRVQGDPWEPLVAEWLEAPYVLVDSGERPVRRPYDASAGVRTVDVLVHAIGMRPEHIKKLEEMRVAVILRAQGYERGPKHKESGVEVRRYVKATTSTTSPKSQNEVVSQGGRPQSSVETALDSIGDHLDHLKPKTERETLQPTPSQNVGEDDRGGRGGLDETHLKRLTVNQALKSVGGARPPPTTTPSKDHLRGGLTAAATRTVSLREFMRREADREGHALQ